MSAATPGGAGLGVGLGRDDGAEIGADETVGLGDDVCVVTHAPDVRQIDVEQPDATTEKVRAIASNRPTCLPNVTCRRLTHACARG